MVDERHPMVSIGMPIFNAEAYLAEAIESVLAQTFRDFELIVCDNASTDATERICREFAGRDERIRYYRNETNIGAAANFNLAFEHARGEFFKWMAHDDRIAPSYLERCVAMYTNTDRERDAAQPQAANERHEEVVLVFPRRVYITHDGRPVEGEPDLLGPPGPASFDRIDFRRLAGLCSSRCPIFVFGLMPRAVVATTGLMGNYPGADLVFVGEMKMRGVFREVPEELFVQRLHARTPDVLDRMTKKGDAAWFDPQHRRKKKVRIERKLLAEFVRAVVRAPLSGSEKCVHLWHLRRHVAFRIRRKLFLSVRRSRMKLWNTWTRIAVAAARYSEHSFVPLRGWVMLSALRGRTKQLRLALSPPGRRSEAALLDFAASHLFAHSHPESERLLDDWIETGDRSRWWAALKARCPRTTARSDAKPILSIRMTVSDTAAGTDEAIEDAIESLLRQRIADFELIIEAPNASAGRIEQLASRESRIRVTANGVASRIDAIRSLSGRYYAELDPCDVVHPDRFVAQIAHLETHPETLAVGCQTLLVDAAGNPIADRANAPAGFTSRSALFVRDALLEPGILDGSKLLDAPAFGEVAVLPQCLHRTRNSAEG